MTTKSLNLTQSEMVALVGLIRDGILARELRRESSNSNTDRFLLNYAQAQAGYTTSFSPELLARLASFSPELLARLGITG